MPPSFPDPQRTSTSMTGVRQAGHPDLPVRRGRLFRRERRAADLPNQLGADLAGGGPRSAEKNPLPAQTPETRPQGSLSRRRGNAKRTRHAGSRHDRTGRHRSSGRAGRRDLDPPRRRRGHERGPPPPARQQTAARPEERARLPACYRHRNPVQTLGVHTGSQPCTPIPFRALPSRSVPSAIC